MGQQSAGALVARARRGGERAWREIVDRFTPLLLWVARSHRLGEHDVADVVQTTWTQCVQNLDAVRDPDSLGAWLATTCRRASLRALRDLSRTWPHGDDAAVVSIAAGEADGDPYDVVAKRDDATRLYAAIHRLPQRQRSVLVALLWEDGAGYASLADRLGMPIGSLGPTRRRALERLRQDPRLAPLAAPVG